MRFLAANFLLLMVGCHSGITIPPIPTWQEPSDPRIISAAEVKANAAVVLPGVPVYHADSDHTLVNYEWLQDFLYWEWEVANILGVVYVPESFDCDDFAVSFAWATSRAAAKAGIKAAPLVARLVVLQSMNPPTRHAMIGVATDRGIFIVEPQPDAGPFRIKPLVEFRGGTILSVVLGDFNP